MVWTVPDGAFATGVTKQFDKADPSRAASRRGHLPVARRPDTLHQTNHGLDTLQTVLIADSSR